MSPEILAVMALVVTERVGSHALAPLSLQNRRDSLGLGDQRSGNLEVHAQAMAIIHQRRAPTLVFRAAGVGRSVLAAQALRHRHPSLDQPRLSPGLLRMRGRPASALARSRACTATVRAPGE